MCSSKPPLAVMCTEGVSCCALLHTSRPQRCCSRCLVVDSICSQVVLARHSPLKQRDLFKQLCTLAGCGDAACRHWANQHGGQTRQLQALQEAKQQAEGQIHQLTAKLEQEQRQLAQQHERWAPTVLGAPVADKPDSWTLLDAA